MQEEKILRKKGTSRVDDLFFGWRGQPNAGCWLVCGGGSAIVCEKYGQVVLNKPLMILFLDGPKCQSLHVPSEKKQSVSTIKTPYASSSSTKYMLVVLLHTPIYFQQWSTIQYTISPWIQKGQIYLQSRSLMMMLRWGKIWTQCFEGPYFGIFLWISLQKACCNGFLHKTFSLTTFPKSDLDPSN